MQAREHTRCSTVKAVMVILTLPVKSIYPLIGPLADISEAGLCFTYLPLQEDIDIPVQERCEVVLKYGFRSFSEPIPCRIVYNTITRPTGSSFMVPIRRCGIQFLTPLPALDLECICS